MALSALGAAALAGCGGSRTCSRKAGTIPPTPEGPEGVATHPPVGVNAMSSVTTSSPPHISIEIGALVVGPDGLQRIVIGIKPDGRVMTVGAPDLPWERQGRIEVAPAHWFIGVIPAKEVSSWS